MAIASDGRMNFGKVAAVLDVPNLIEIQVRSFESFLQKDVLAEQREDKGLQSAFSSVFPITDYNETASIEFIEYMLGEPKFTIDECLYKGLTYAVPLRIRVRLNLWEAGADGARALKESKEQEVYIGEMPLMTADGTFIINGTERVIVSQLHRSPGVFFSHDKGKTHASGRLLYSARVIPARGSWLDFEFDAKDILYVRIDRRKKLPATIVLKALGYSNEELLKTFYPVETVKVSPDGSFSRPVDKILQGVRTKEAIFLPGQDEPLIKEGSKITRAALKRLENAGVVEIPAKREELVGRITLKDIIDPETGEVVLESNEPLTDDAIEVVLSMNIPELDLLYIDNMQYLPALRDTLLSDKVENQDAALVEIYKKLRPGEPPTLNAARELFDGLFFDPKRYDLSPVGRLKINKRLNLEIPLTKKVLTSEDIVEIVRALLSLRTGKGEVDDIDHLGNRRIRSVGELLENQFRIGLVRMERAIKEKMTLTELDEAMPHDLVNAKPVIASVKEFFGSSQLSQFMDQTNPLSEITHKRRLSALGPGGLTRERAGFEVRDVHPTHYGRICPVETPEGPNIGLITSLATYARVNDYGFIEVPYKRVEKGRVTEDVKYFSAIEGEKFVIAEGTTPVDKNGKITTETVAARVGGDPRIVTAEEIQYMDVSPKQIVGVSAALIPFLENDDANRALMGSNMQRQAVPLLRSESPVVGTGMEAAAARDSGSVVLARRAGVIESVDAKRIVVGAEGGAVDIYKLVKYRRSNQATNINQKPIVSLGQKVEKGEVLADGSSTEQGELALGKNVLVAFMPWGGYNFEDAILVSEKLVREDVYTSIHIEEFEVEARETKLGPEEITRDIPNVGEEALKDLDESGIIRIGAKVKPGDILVGKVTPKGETQLTPEEKLLRAIFGEKAEDVKESCLYVPPGIEGTVIDTRILSRKGVAKDERSKRIEDEEVARLQRDLEEEVRLAKQERYRRIRELFLNKTTAEDFVPPRSKDVLIPQGKKITARLLDEVRDSYLTRLKVTDQDVLQEILRINTEANLVLKGLEKHYDERVEALKKGDELAPGVNKTVKVYIAMKRRIQPGDKMAGRHGNKGVVSIVMPVEDMPFLPDGRPVDICLNPLGVPSRMNVGQVLEIHLGWAARTLGIKVATPVFEGAKESDIKALLKKARLSESGQTDLFDGRTGEMFKRQVTVGYMYILKLHHLVEDKIHARSIGPYSLVTQQPLGGKAQFGGQRLGEMEVWALEAYGASHTLQEFLTVKSDDISGRAKTYEAIIKGEPNFKPGVPESFHVLVKELQSLGLDVELLEKKAGGE
jgi:DNA-directed RNA polymerase subunit beta